MCWDFVGMTIEKVKVSCKLQRIVFNFIITFSTKGVLKWRMFGIVLGNWTTYIIHFTLKLKRNGHIHILDGSVSWPQKAFLYAFNFFNNENFLLDICSQQFGEKMSVEYIFWYLIYHANTSWSWSIGEYNWVEMYICIDARETTKVKGAQFLCSCEAFLILQNLNPKWGTS